jgi:hypothetical protein
LSDAEGDPEVIRFVRAHGSDPGPTERPFVAGALSGLLATGPGVLVFVAFGSFQVAADDVMRLPRPPAAALMLCAFTLAGLAYGACFRRAANDKRAGWLLGLAYGFALWIAAPVAVLPLIRGPTMAAGLAATGFFVTFLLWGLIVGVLFPYVHRPLHATLGGEGLRSPKRFGPEAVTLKQRLLRRPG